jgi:hypothetical protein
VSLERGLTQIASDLTDPEQHRIEQEKSSRSKGSFQCFVVKISKYRRFRVATAIGETAVIVTRDGQGAD